MPNNQGEMIGRNEEEEEADVSLDFSDEELRVNTLHALNMMRKNRHFCDVILHVCALAVQHYILHVSVDHSCAPVA